jgi:Ser/Thr protein kinase RdoA (MazF antagonist)
MSQLNLHNRINFDGKLSDLINEISDIYYLGKVNSFRVIEIGFEDFNIKLITTKGEYVIKIFSKGRTIAQVKRYVETIKMALSCGVNHPKLISIHSGEFLFAKTRDLQLIVMEYVRGSTFYDLSRTPNKDELMLICTEAVKINSMQYEPEYIFDSWAIPNMKWMYKKTKDHLSAEGLYLVKKAFSLYNSIPLNALPRCFVHGDLTKTNLIAGNDHKVYVLDFAVANVYPRIQELAVMVANLMFDEKAESTMSLREKVDLVVNTYIGAGGNLAQIEIDNLMNYVLPGAAMEYIGSVNERIIGDTSQEIQYWEKLGLDTLREALG